MSGSVRPPGPQSLAVARLALAKVHVQYLAVFATALSWTIGCRPTTPPRNPQDTTRTVAAPRDTHAPTTPPDETAQPDPRAKVIKRVALELKDPVRSVISLRNAGAPVDWDPATFEAIQKEVSQDDPPNPSTVTLSNVTVQTAIAIALDAADPRYRLTAWVEGRNVIVGRRDSSARAEALTLCAYDLHDLLEDARRWQRRAAPTGQSDQREPQDEAVVRELVDAVDRAAPHARGATIPGTVCVGDTLVVAAPAAAHEELAQWIAAFRDDTRGARRIPPAWHDLHRQIATRGTTRPIDGMARAAPARKFENAPLSNVLEELATSTAMNLYVADIILRQSPAQEVTVDWTGLNAGQALDATLRAAPNRPTWREWGGVAFIGPVDSLTGSYAFTVIDVRDLIARRAARAGSPDAAADQLIREIEKRPDTGQWEGSGLPGGIHLTAGRLIIWQSTSGLSAIERYVRQLREHAE